MIMAALVSVGVTTTPSPLQDVIILGDNWVWGVAGSLGLDDGAIVETCGGVEARVGGVAVDDGAGVGVGVGVAAAV